MAGRLIAPESNPEVRPISIGEVLQRIIAICVHNVAKGEACGIDQLCGGLQAVMEGGVHAMR